jgi:hypothetical protein
VALLSHKEESELFYEGLWWCLISCNSIALFVEGTEFHCSLMAPVCARSLHTACHTRGVGL